MKHKGFTLIELMIVIAIIAIIMAFAVPAYRNFVVKTKAAEALTLMANLKTTVAEIWYLGTEIGSINSGSNGIGEPGYYVGDWVDRITVSSGVITAFYNSDDPDLAGNSTSINPIAPGTGVNSGKGLMWNCQTSLGPNIDPC